MLVLVRRAAVVTLAVRMLAVALVVGVLALVAFASNTPEENAAGARVSHALLLNTAPPQRGSSTPHHPPTAHACQAPSTTAAWADGPRGL